MAEQNPNTLEEWRAVVGYESLYEVSNLGRVRNIKARNGTSLGLILKQNPNGMGYAALSLTSNGISRSRRVHVLVARAFMGLPPDSLEVGHIDDDKMNPRLDNLEYITHLENVRRGVRTGCRKQHHRGDHNQAAKLDEATVRAIRQEATKGHSYSRLAVRHGVAKSQVARIVTRESWPHVQ